MSSTIGRKLNSLKISLRFDPWVMHMYKVLLGKTYQLNMILGFRGISLMIASCGDMLGNKYI